MLNRLLSITLVLLSTVSAARTEDEPAARLRAMQLSFVPQVSAVADFQVDDSIVFESISFPFATDYLEFAPGDHTLTATIVDHGDATASTSVTLKAGHSYSVVVEGDYSANAVNFSTIDETSLIGEPTGSDAIIVNLTAGALDIYINDEAVLRDVATGDYGFIALPDTPFTGSATRAGMPDEFLFSEDFEPFPNITLLAVMRQSTSDDLQAVMHRSSDLTIADYLQSAENYPDFSTIAALMTAADLADLLPDDEAFTLFLPTNDALAEVSDFEIPSDTATLRTLLSYHVVSQNLPPTVLPRHSSQTATSGDTLFLAFGDTDSGYWEIDGAPILWDIRLANGVIYAIDGIYYCTLAEWQRSHTTCR